MTSIAESTKHLEESFRSFPPVSPRSDDDSNIDPWENPYDPSANVLPSDTYSTTSFPPNISIPQLQAYPQPQEEKYSEQIIHRLRFLDYRASNPSSFQGIFERSVEELTNSMATWRVSSDVNSRKVFQTDHLRPSTPPKAPPVTPTTPKAHRDGSYAASLASKKNPFGRQLQKNFSHPPSERLPIRRNKRSVIFSSDIFKNTPSMGKRGGRPGEFPKKHSFSQILNLSCQKPEEPSDLELVKLVEKIRLTNRRKH